MRQLDWWSSGWWTYSQPGRNTYCPLKKFTYYRDPTIGVAKNTFGTMITFNEFVLSSNLFSHSILLNSDGLTDHGIEICVLSVMEYSNHLQWLKENNIQKNDSTGHYMVVHPETGAETGIIFKDIIFHSREINTISNSFDLAENMVVNGVCKTVSVGLHGVYKSWPGVLENTTSSMNAYDYWNSITRQVLDVEPSSELRQLIKYFKRNFLGEKKYLSLVIRALKVLDFSDADLDMWRMCYQNVVTIVKKIMYDNGIKTIFLASDILVRNTTGETPQKSQEYAHVAFDVITESGLNFITNLESQPFSETYGKDRGVSGIIDQKLSMEADYFVTLGVGAFNRRVVYVRNEKNLHVQELNCQYHYERKEPSVEVVVVLVFSVGVTLLLLARMRWAGCLTKLKKFQIKK